MTVADPDAVVTRQLRRLAEYARVEPSPGTAELTPDTGGRPRRWRAGAVAAAVAVLALVGASLALLGRADHRVVAVGAAAPLGGSTELLAPSGLSPRSEPASVWTGRELLVWGGTAHSGSASNWLADGAAFDPSSNRWRPLPPAPIAARSDAAAVWTGSEMLIWGGSANGESLADGAAFNPQTNRWRTIAVQPFGGGMRPVAVWTGSEMLVVTQFNAPLVASAYDPRTDHWRRLATPEGALVMPYPQGVWTGAELVLVLWPSSSPILGGPGSPSPVATAAPSPASPVPPPVAAPPTTGLPSPPPPLLPAPVPVLRGPNSDMFLVSYSPATDTWSRLPPVALKDGTLPRLAWTGHEILLLESAAPGAAFDPARGAWRPLAAPPAPSAVSVSPVWTGRFAVFWAGGSTGYAYDAARDFWFSYDAGGLTARNDGVVAWTGDYLLGWGGFATDGTGSSENDGIRFRPSGG